MHPYLRAYMSGITLPSIVVPFVLAVLALTHSDAHPFHIEDVAIFPLGLVPNAWGLWNMLYVWLRRRVEVPIGLYGASLVVVLAPLAFGIQTALGKMIWTLELFAIGFPVGLALYYLAWKHLVARLNDILGIG